MQHPLENVFQEDVLCPYSLSMIFLWECQYSFSLLESFAIASGIFILVAKVAGGDLRTIARQATALGQKGLDRGSQWIGRECHSVDRGGE